MRCVFLVPAASCAALLTRRGRRVVRAASALVVLVTAALAVAVPSSAATRECFLLTQCTPVVGPWVVIPAATRTPIPAGVTVSCPDSDSLQLAVGSDYELSGGGALPYDVTRYMPGPGIGLITGGSAAFFAITFSDTPASFRPHVGCIPEPRGQAARQASTTHSVRTRDVRLGPSRTVTGSHRCRGGERLVRGVAGVLFDRRRPPTARELREVTVTHRTGVQRVRARVRTGPTVGDRERVTLQILAVCAR
jgi:hypothetical protein